MTVQELVTAALRDLAIIGAVDTPTAEDSQLAFDRLNDWIDALGTQGLTMFRRARTTWTIVASTTSYAVGTSSTVNVARPNAPDEIENIGYIDTSTDPDTEYLLGPVLTEDEYAAIQQKALTATVPTCFYYAPTLATGTLYPWPVPTSSSLTGVIYTPIAVTEFTALADTITLPKGYRRFLRTNLAVELAGAFGVQPSPLLVQAAIESKANVERSNIRLRDMSVAVPFGGGQGYDINVGP